MATVRAFIVAALMCSLGLAQDTSYETFADVVAFINCDRRQRGVEALQWSDGLAANSASSDLPNEQTPTPRWKVAWLGAQRLESFERHFLGTQSAYEGNPASLPREDYMAMVWSSAATIGCSTRDSGYVCLLETHAKNPFFGRTDASIKQRWMTESAACSQDRLCPVHGEDEAQLCQAAGCFFEPSWTRCERPNKNEDKNSIRATFALMLGTLNCERRKRGAYPAYWNDNAVDWAFKLRAADSASEYEHAFLPGSRSWDVAWSGDDTMTSFDTFLSDARAAYENPTPQTASLRLDYMTLMSKGTIFIGCYKAGKSNACAMHLQSPVSEDSQLGPLTDRGCPRDSTSGIAEVEGPFAGVVDYINCARTRRFSERLQWSEDLAQLASSASDSGFVGGGETRWSVAWSGDDLLEGFEEHFDRSESAHAGDATAALSEDFMAMVWKSGKKIGCAMTVSGSNAYACVVETMQHGPFMQNVDAQVKRSFITQKAACSKDSLCPAHREGEESACIAASCSWESRWATCERPDKAQDAASIKATFADMLAALNCERKRRGAYGAYWSDGNVDWAFKLRAADAPSKYEHAFLLGGRSWDFAWSGDDVLDSFSAFLSEAQSAYESPTPETSSLKNDYAALMSKSAIFVGCYKEGESNACVVHMYAPLTEDAQVEEPSGPGCGEESRSRSDRAMFEAPFAGVVDHINCARARRLSDKLAYSYELATLASGSPEPGFIGGDKSRWSVTWSGDDLLAGFMDHFSDSESAYIGLDGQTTGTPKEDFMVMVWDSATKFGCDVSISGNKDHVCVFETLPQVPFLEKSDRFVREVILSERAACSEDRLCPIHGENDHLECLAASCSWESGWTWCERPNKAQDSMKTIFKEMLATLNCERKQRGLGAVFWDERDADWAFKLRAEDTTSDYEYAFLRGSLRDFAWSDDDVVKGFGNFLAEVESAYKQPTAQTSAMSETFMALMSTSAIKLGCYKSGESNACVLRFSTPFDADAAADVGKRGDGDCSKEGREKLRSVETSSDSDVDLMAEDNGSCRVCGIGSMLVLILVGAAEMHKS